MNAKQLWLRSDVTGEQIPLARFVLADGGLTAVYCNEVCRQTLESTGITAVIGDRQMTVFPRDGKPFFDALEASYARDPMLVVSSAGS